MKKTVWIMVIALAIALVTPACKNEPDPGDTHTYSTAWSFDATQHWHECTANDGAKNAVANHTELPCSVCGYTHTHSYSNTWSYDATQHWHECTVGDGAKNDVANHTGNTCSVCGYDSTATSVTFSSLTADGSASATTTTLALTFSPAIAITANDISLSGGRAKRTLERHGANLYPAD